MSDPKPAPKSTLVPLALWERVTDEQKVQLADRLFFQLMYGVDDLSGPWGPSNYGFPDNGGDVVVAVDKAFNEITGVNIPQDEDADEEQRFRFVNHYQPDGAWCEFSLVGVAEPAQRNHPGNLRCPLRCPDSTIETAPSIED